MQIISIDEDRCALCGTCIAVCPRRMLTEEDGSIKIIDPAQCILCGHCKAVCPEDAFQFPGLEDAEFAPVPQKATLPGPEGLMALFRSRRSTRIFRKQPVER
ncbi:MAG: 4Fe-4S binding protein, partial [Proteobacteria bacterium]|nr:4Fe-4S binding protein [Pseudomonadota bacterium]